MIVGRFLRNCVLFVMLAACPGAALAADTGLVPTWPAGDVKVTLPFSEGNESDAFFNLFKDAFAARTGKRFIANRISGQAGADAWARMADDAPDGSAITVVVFPNIILRSHLPDSGVYPSAMAFCHVGAYMPCVLWTTEPSSFDSAQAVADAARGMNGRFPVAGPGRYSAGQVAARKFDRLTGVKSTYIPYAGTVEAARAVRNGQAAVFWGFTVPVSIPGVSFKPLAVAAKERVSSMRHVPTFYELGIDLMEGAYFGIAVPGETSEYTREDISVFFSECAESGILQDSAREMGFAPLNIKGEDAAVFVREQTAAARRTVEEFDLLNQ